MSPRKNWVRQLLFNKTSQSNHLASIVLRETGKGWNVGHLDEEQSQATDRAECDRDRNTDGYCIEKGMMQQAEVEWSLNCRNPI